LSKSVLISACLVGENCRFDGEHSLRNELLELLEGKDLIPVCSEVEGGLSVPRPPAEIRAGRVYRQSGEDVTSNFNKGAEICLKLGKTHEATLAILKSRSPACGCGQVYDGSFSGKLVEGDGIFTKTLKNAGIECISDEDYLSNIS